MFTHLGILDDAQRRKRERGEWRSPLDLHFQFPLRDNDRYGSSSHTPISHITCTSLNPLVSISHTRLRGVASETYVRTLDESIHTLVLLSSEFVLIDFPYKPATARAAGGWLGRQGWRGCRSGPNTSLKLTAMLRSQTWPVHFATVLPSVPSYTDIDQISCKRSRMRILYRVCVSLQVADYWSA